MIQRIQTIFLFIVVISSISLYFIGDGILLFGFEYTLLIFTVVSVFLGMISILSFKKRKKQILFNQLNLFVNLLLIGALLYWLLNLSGGISFPEKGIELVFPTVSVIGLLLANIYIKRDNKLVKSVDRLR